MCCGSPNIKERAGSLDLEARTCEAAPSEMDRESVHPTEKNSLPTLLLVRHSPQTEPEKCMSQLNQCFS
jgi:hypothetical protein